MCPYVKLCQVQLMTIKFVFVFHHFFFLFCHYLLNVSIFDLKIWFNLDRKSRWCAWTSVKLCLTCSTVLLNELIFSETMHFSVDRNTSLLRMPFQVWYCSFSSDILDRVTCFIDFSFFFCLYISLLFARHQARGLAIYIIQININKNFNFRHF